MSVRMMTPRPRSTRRTAAARRSLIPSGVSPGSVVTASSPSTGPRTLSSVCTIASATRPCPTTMIPTIPDPYSAVLCAASCARRSAASGVTMPDEDRVAMLLKSATQLLDQYDGTVAPTGAAERDREIALPLTLIVRQREFQELDHQAQELLRLGALEHVARDLRFQSGLWPELLDEVRVRQEATVERQIGIGRQAELVAEGLQHDGHRPGGDT